MTAIDLSGVLLRLVNSYESLGRDHQVALCRSLRGEGLTYSEIRQLVPVPKGTLSSWVADVAMSPTAFEAKLDRSSQLGIPRDTQRRRRAEVQQLRTAAFESAPALLPQPLWMAGVALYWGEGAKTERRLSITNSDAVILRVFHDWCVRYLDPLARFSCAIHVHDETQIPEATDYWSRELGLGHDCFTKPYIKKPGTGHRTVVLEHGILRLSLRQSADAWVTVMAWIDFVKSNDW